MLWALIACHHLLITFHSHLTDHVKKKTRMESFQLDISGLLQWRRCREVYSCKGLFTIVKSLLWPQPIHIVFANMNQCLEVWPSSLVKSISTCIRVSHLLVNWWVTFTYVMFILISATVSSGWMCISQRFEEVSFWKTNSSVLVMNFSLLQSPLFLLDSCIMFLRHWL